MDNGACLRTIIFTLLLLINLSPSRSDQRNCRDASVDASIHQADVIISGQVRKLSKDLGANSSSTYSAYVQVNRIIKGQHLLYDYLNVKVVGDSFTKTHSNNNSTTIGGLRRAKKYSLVGNIIRVQNFANKSYCNSLVEPGDFRIFLLKYDSNRESKFRRAAAFSLFSSLIESRTTNEHSNTFTANIDSSTLSGSKCSDAATDLCQFGASCALDSHRNLIYCECDINCDQYDPMPLCGSDGHTYQSLCHLKLTKCIQQRSIRIINHNSCQQLEQSLCKSKTCPHYGVCKIDEHDFYAKCVCPSECDTSNIDELKDHSLNLPSKLALRLGREKSKRKRLSSRLVSELFNHAVCGTNGLDYRNFCELKKHSCKSNTEIQVFHYGKCNPCDDLKCEYPRTCRLNNKREPECVCNFECDSHDYKPICATNGKTYLNECFMRLEACRLDRQLAIFGRGECVKLDAQNPCDELECDQYHGAYCTIDQDGRAMCKCEANCELTLSYVCGSDGVTYNNECLLRKESCESNQFIAVLHAGICGAMNPCMDHRCNFGGTCALINNRPVCQCIECNEEWSPVCGTNKVTYSNVCKLRQESCQQQKLIEIAYEGACDRCRSVSCAFHATCVDNGFSIECTCPPEAACDEMPNNNIQQLTPVCGSDSKTYASECHMNSASCKSKRLITKLHNGHCDPCAALKCDATLKNEKLCASDGNTYLNECFLRMEECLTKTKIDILHQGSCYELSQKRKHCGNCTKFRGECVHFADIDSYKCLCTKFDCANFERTSSVCGSNGKKYANKCELEKDKCLTQTEIHEQSFSQCSDEKCDCDPIGSLNQNCDSKTSKCECKMGHAGLECSSCLQNYWRLDEKHGCTPCDCNKFGSLNEVCDQETGQCLCKPGVRGFKCSECETETYELKANGCVSILENEKQRQVESLCSTVHCNYPGAYCSIDDESGMARCVCESIECNDNDHRKVCGEDGQTYASTCDLIKFSCMKQTNIEIAHFGQCNQANFLDALSNNFPLNLIKSNKSSNKFKYKANNRDNSKNEYAIVKNEKLSNENFASKTPAFPTTITNSIKKSDQYPTVKEDRITSSSSSFSLNSSKSFISYVIALVFVLKNFFTMVD